MTDAFAQEYSRFAKEKLRPAVEDISRQKRAGIVRGAVVGVLCFLLGMGGVYLFLKPYRGIIDDTDVSMWPLMIMAPAAMGVLVFSLVFVLSLRKTVDKFRGNLVASMAEFIDPGLVAELGHPITRDAVMASHLFSDDADVKIGNERFRGRAGDAAVEFADIWLKENGMARRGLFFIARTESSFPYPHFVYPSHTDVSRSRLEAALVKEGYPLPGGLVRIDRDHWQFLVPSGEEEEAHAMYSREFAARLNAVHDANGGELYLSRRDTLLNIALLSPGTGKEGVSVFESFDFDGCREFCRDAKLAMSIARRGAQHQDVGARFLS